MIIMSFDFCTHTVFLKQTLLLFLFQTVDVEVSKLMINEVSDVTKIHYINIHTFTRHTYTCYNIRYTLTFSHNTSFKCITCIYQENNERRYCIRFVKLRKYDNHNIYNNTILYIHVCVYIIGVYVNTRRRYLYGITTCTNAIFYTP